VLFPSITSAQILAILIAGTVLALGAGIWMAIAGPEDSQDTKLTREGRSAWRMPPLSALPPARLTLLNRVWLMVLRVYLVAAVGLVIFRVTQLALHVA
jgi:hypothetical protein